MVLSEMSWKTADEQGNGEQPASPDQQLGPAVAPMPGSQSVLRSRSSLHPTPQITGAVFTQHDDGDDHDDDGGR